MNMPISVAPPPDTTPPTVTINQAVGQADPTSTSPINFTAVFSEPVSGFIGTDVTIGGTAGGTKTVTVSGGPSTYNAAVSGMTTSGTVLASIPAGVAQDAAGNPNTASTSTDNSVSFTSSDPSIQWSAHFETGNLSEYDGQNTTGNAISTAVTAASQGITAHGGSWVMKQTVTAPSGGPEASGTRMYVYGALDAIYRTGNPIYYSFWAWFPASFTWTAGGFYNALQIQSIGPSGTDPVWILGIHPTNFTFRLEWWGNLQMSGPHSGETGGHTYDQATVIPTGQWIFMEVLVTPREDYTGQVKIWQDGVVIFDQTSVKTKYPESLTPPSTQGFFIAKTAYGQNFATPNIHYVDDATISLGRIP